MEAAVRVRMTAEEKIAALQKKIQQVKALDEKKKLRELGDVLKKSSSQETRKKILVGAFVMANFAGDLSKIAIENKSFADSLTRDDDRALFGLAPLKKPTAKTAQAQAPRSGYYSEQLKAEKAAKEKELEEQAKAKAVPGFAEDAVARARRLAAEKEAAAKTGRA